MYPQINKLLFLYSRTHKTKKPFSMKEGLLYRVILKFNYTGTLHTPMHPFSMVCWLPALPGA
jgi:hypothetical protein